MKYHAIRIEFQVCSFLCIIDAPVLSNLDEYIQFTDGFVKVFLSDIKIQTSSIYLQHKSYTLIQSHARIKKNEKRYQHF